MKAGRSSGSGEHVKRPRLHSVLIPSAGLVLVGASASARTERSPVIEAAKHADKTAVRALLQQKGVDVDAAHGFRVR